MSEKYFNIDIDDPRASAIAEVMSNKTAKKILSIIAEKELTESDIASELDIPLNTVGYNIDKLLKAGLIEKSKSFFWSVKGKKMPTYKLSNKKILISPKRMIPAVPMTFIGLLIGVIALIALIGFVNERSLISDNETLVVSEGNALNQFASYDELEKYLSEKAKERKESSGGIFENLGDSVTGIAPTASASTKAGGSASDYSQTNIQVAGVDEPDFVKNDGKYIYTISGNVLYILDAYPAENMKVISNISLNSYATNILVNDDKLVVFLQGYEQYNADDIVEGVAEESIVRCLGYRCGGYSISKTIVNVYDISDRNEPKLESNYSFDGGYIGARMIGDNVYLISQQYLYNYGVPRPIYSLNGIENEVSISDIYYSDEYDENFAFTYVSAIDLKKQDANVKVYLLGTSSTIYVSESNIYLTSEKWLGYEKQIELKIKEGIVPMMSGNYLESIENILESDDYAHGKEQKVMKVVYNYSKSLGYEEQSVFLEDLKKSIEKAEIKISKEYEKTNIHKIEINGLNIRYKATGEVPGHLLNQFSMDEYNGNLRVAVTTGGWRAATLNHLYVLDKNLEIIGRVDDLAKGERIYSARFIGDKAYMVTFRQVDPLYVIDLSNPDEPEVLGYLKITGYSSYLHPYDENHIIGIGMEANEQGRVSGVKIALFDVSDFYNPKESAKYEIKSGGDWSWSSSEALYEHKAFLFDKENNLLVVPIQYSYYFGDKYRSWNGAYVFDIDFNSIELKGKITHNEGYKPKYISAKEEAIGAERMRYSSEQTWVKEDYNEWKLYVNDVASEQGSYYYPGVMNDKQIDALPGGVDYESYDYSWQRRIQRSLYMDSTLYTISQTMVKANDLSNLREVNKVDFGYEENYYGGPNYAV